jgi:cytochrome c556
MTRWLMITVAALGLGVTAVAAQQQDASTARRELMRSNGKALYSDMGKMAKGEVPYAQATVDAALAMIDENLKKMPPLWAANVSRAPAQGGNFKSADKAFEDQAGFKTKIDDNAKLINEQKAAIKNLEALKAGVGTINNSCNGCHEIYRQRNS